MVHSEAEESEKSSTTGNECSGTRCRWGSRLNEDHLVDRGFFRFLVWQRFFDDHVIAYERVGDAGFQLVECVQWS